jgi:hypothetical protein
LGRWINNDRHRERSAMIQTHWFCQKRKWRQKIIADSYHCLSSDTFTISPLLIPIAAYIAYDLATPQKMAEK